MDILKTNETLILGSLTGGAKTWDEIRDATGLSYKSIKEHLDRLVGQERVLLVGVDASRTGKGPRPYLFALPGHNQHERANSLETRIRRLEMQLGRLFKALDPGE